MYKVSLAKLKPSRTKVLPLEIVKYLVPLSVATKVIFKVEFPLALISNCFKFACKAWEYSVSAKVKGKSVIKDEVAPTIVVFLL